MWWIFKYDSQINPKGIGIHADPAAVNINLWLTDDEACVEGGGLRIYSHVPPLEGKRTQEVNHEFKSEDDEARLRAELSGAGEVTTVPYRCNRACIFVSDQYHESLPFKFRTGYAQRRANLTLLFGDRWSPLPSPANASGSAASRREAEVGQEGTPGGGAAGTLTSAAASAAAAAHPVDSTSTGRSPAGPTPAGPTPAGPSPAGPTPAGPSTLLSAAQAKATPVPAGAGAADDGWDVFD